MSGIIPKEEAGDFTRWQIGSFDTPATARPKARPPAPPPEPVKVDTTPQLQLPTEEELARIHEEARAAGYQTGYDAGLAEGLKTAEDRISQATATEAAQIATLTESLQRSLEQLDQDVADHLLALATEIAAQVIRGTLKLREDALLPVVREAIAALPIHHAHVTLRLHPDDAERVRKLMGEQLAQSGTQVLEDNDMAPGGCIVRAGNCEVDAAIETRWKRVLETIGMAPEKWTSN